MKTKTIIIICASVALVGVIAFFAFRILDFVENPPETPPPPAEEYPVAPTGPPDLPADEENTPEQPAQARINAAGGLRLREGPSVDYEVVTLIPNHEYITLLEEEGGWARVEFGGTTGWVSTEFLLREGDPRFSEEPEEAVVTPGNRSASPTTARIDAENGLRMRMGPGAEYHVVFVIPGGEQVRVHDESDGWIYIEYLGHWGWVSAEFLRQD